MIIVEGNLRTRTYDDKRYPEVRHYVTEVYADNVQFGETKAASQAHGSGYAPQQFQQPQQYNNAPQYNNSQPAQAQQPAPSISMGDLGDFEEVIGDSDLPF